MAAPSMLQRTKAALDTVGAAQLSQLLRAPAALAMQWQQPGESKAAPRHEDAVPAMVFLGPPGVGKGTYSTRVAERFGVAHVSAGDLARDEMRAGTARGQQVGSLCQLLTPYQFKLRLVSVLYSVELAILHQHVCRLLKCCPHNLPQPQRARLPCCLTSIPSLGPGGPCLG